MEIKIYRVPYIVDEVFIQAESYRAIAVETQPYGTDHDHFTRVAVAGNFSAFESDYPAAMLSRNRQRTIGCWQTVGYEMNEGVEAVSGIYRLKFAAQVMVQLYKQIDISVLNEATGLMSGSWPEILNKHPMLYRFISGN